MIGRAFAAKSFQAAGLVLVGMALIIGLRDDDMGKELLTLAFGSAVFLGGRALEPRE